MITMVFELTHSDLLFTSADGTQRFTHDTYQDYFLALAESKLIKDAPDQSVTVAHAYSRLLHLNSEHGAGTDSADNLDNFPFGYTSFEFEKSSTFLDSMLENLSHPFSERILQDPFFDLHFFEPTFFCAGDNSKLVIHFRSGLDLDYMGRFEKQMAVHDIIAIYYHFLVDYKISLFASSNEIYDDGRVAINPIVTYFSSSISEKSNLFRFDDPHLNHLLRLNHEQKNGSYGCDNPYLIFLQETADIKESEIKYGISADIEEIFREQAMFKLVVQHLSAPNQSVAVLTQPCAICNPYPYLCKGISYLHLKPLVGKPIDFLSHR